MTTNKNREAVMDAYCALSDALAAPETQLLAEHRHAMAAALGSLRDIEWAGPFPPVCIVALLEEDREGECRKCGIGGACTVEDHDGQVEAGELRAEIESQTADLMKQDAVIAELRERVEQLKLVLAYCRVIALPDSASSAERREAREMIYNALRGKKEVRQ